MLRERRMATKALPVFVILLYSQAVLSRPKEPYEPFEDDQEGSLGSRYDTRGIISIASEESLRQPPPPPPTPKHDSEGQGQEEVRGQDDGHEDEERPENLTIPISMWSSIRDVKSTGQFITGFLRRPSAPASTARPGEYPRPRLNHSSPLIYTESGQIIPESFELVVSKVAVPDGCSPRSVSVDFPAPADPAVIYWPFCTRVKRCGGCCGHGMFECAPTEEQIIAKQVIEARFPYRGADHMEYMGLKTVTMVQHNACECRCRVQPHHCTEHQEYLPDACRCQCLNQEESASCPDNKRWDEKDCTCVCKNTHSCEDGQHYSNSTCRCEEQTSKTKNTETTTIPMSATPDPCRDLRCRPGFTANRFKKTCRCLLSTHWRNPVESLDRHRYHGGYVYDDYNRRLGPDSYGPVEYDKRT